MDHARTRGGEGRRIAGGQLTVIAALAPVAVALGTTSAGAALPRATSGSIQGTVEAVVAATHTFTLRTTTGSKVTVKATASTAYRDSSVRSPSFADVKVGRSVAVIGTAVKGIDDAAIVIIGGTAPSGPGPTARPGFGGPGGLRPNVFGAVTSVDAAKHTFVVKTSAGSVTVDVVSSTTFRDRGTATATFASVKVGAQVAVVATTSGHVVKATSVILGGFGGPGGLRPNVFGAVTSVDAAKHTFVVKTSAGSVTVDVVSSTTFRDRGTATATFASVKVGAQVAVVGTRSGRVEKARSVFIGFGAPAGARG